MLSCGFRVVQQVDDYSRAEPLISANEAETLLSFLEYHRATLAWKCSGLTAGELNTKLPTSTMTLGGLLKNLAFVEDNWFSHYFLDNDRQPPWNHVDWASQPEWDWQSAKEDSG